jgi:hypothetical protein
VTALTLTAHIRTDGGISAEALADKVRWDLAFVDGVINVDGVTVAPLPAPLPDNHTFAGKTDTSREAARIASLRAGTARHDVLAAIAKASTGWDRHGFGPIVGLTDDELDACLPHGPNTVRPRRVECVRNGWIVDSGQRRNSVNGLACIVWVATPAGIAALAALPARSAA